MPSLILCIGSQGSILTCSGVAARRERHHCWYRCVNSLKCYCHQAMPASLALPTGLSCAAFLPIPTAITAAPVLLSSCPLTTCAACRSV